ncbi:transglutaminase [Streptosporangium violaceochromogenes]|nr:transglutaminase [Streptosporangium violaceochromogenes]
MRLSLASGVATGAVAISLYPLFQGGAWFWTSLGAILVTTGIGVLASRFAVPLWLVPPAQLTAVWIFMTAVFTGEEAWAAIVPTRESVTELGLLLAAGFDDIPRLAAPVPPNSGIMALTCGGVGLIAILVDLLAARTHRAALAGLPLLALFTVPAAVITEPIGWPAFIIAALGYLGLLVADGRERVGHWGRTVLVRRTSSYVGQRSSDPGTLRLSGKRIGLTAVVLAILLPAVLPTLETNPLFGYGAGAGKGRGGNSISIPNPIVSLRGRLTLPGNSTVMTYTTDDGSPRYLRIYTLDVFDGRQWTMTGPNGRPEDKTSAGPLPPPPGQGTDVPVTPVTTKISVSDGVGNLKFLPLPYPPGRIDVAGDWRTDRDTLMVFSTGDTAEGLTYTVVSDEPRPTTETLGRAGPVPPRITERYLRLPKSLPRKVTDLALRVTDRNATPHERAIQLQDFFTRKGGFTYTLTTQGHDDQALTDFLIRNRAGYCEQFAAAMAVMARVVGIPARVAIGYTGGGRLGDGWQVRTHDAHAWPELYFEGTGWLRFEPTPAGGAGQGSATVPPYSRPRTAKAEDEERAGERTTDAGDTGRPDRPAVNRRDRMPDREYGDGPITAEEGLSLPVRAGVGVAIALLAALAPAALRLRTRARRYRICSRAARPAGAAAGADGPGEATAAVWAELDDVLHDHGVSRPPSESPRALAARLGERYGFDAEAAAAAARIAMAAERMLFARTPGDLGSPRPDLRRVRRALAAASPRGVRIRAALLPPSTFRRARALGARVLDGFDRLEGLLPGGSARRGA